MSPTYDPQLHFSEQLLCWYKANKRDLPWRHRDHDPYAVWISEIMLQQTTVAAVIGYFNRWMDRFPTVESLAAAPLDDVLKLWAGLGYYARARNLHKAAQIVVSENGGEVPSEITALLKLPGIGRYTAGAILSIAYNADEPIVDANVVRVLSRVFGVIGNPKTSADTQKELWRLARVLIPTGNASDFNQGMMELGALICDAAAPSCQSCPVAAYCQAHQSGDPTSFPQFEGGKTWREIEDVAVAVRSHDGKLLLIQRPASSALWGGLWELPRTTRHAEESLADCAIRAVSDAVGLAIETGPAFGKIKHVVANRKVTLHGFQSSWTGKTQPATVGCEQYRWTHPLELNAFAMATPQVRLISKLNEFDSQGSLVFSD
jgi:A/G-specific adenine glycosylase